jgi:murein DD-endopeptidase MepM/ murein hydrolase activator NlpD
VSDERCWEVQWHPGGGGKVRRWLLTRRQRRRLLLLAMPAMVAVLALVSVLPFGLRLLLAHFELSSLAREDRELYAEGSARREEAVELAREVVVRRQRLRRLSFVLGLPRDIWTSSVAAVPPADANDETLAVWLTTHSGTMLAEAERIVRAGPSPPCPLDALPTGSPLDRASAVPVALFGWRISPFTGQREAHHGVTLAAVEGEDVFAPGSGRVVFAGKVREKRSNEWTRFGNVVVLDHGGGVLTVFGSLASVAVRRGVRTARGEKLGTVGQSGWTRVPALYYEVRWPYPGGSRPIDPALFDLALPLPDSDARLAAPDCDLPDDWARVEHLPGRRR